MSEERRISKRLCQRHHLVEAIARAEETGCCSAGEIAHMRRELELLTPYWPPGTTKEQAVVAYVAANPGMVN